MKQAIVLLVLTVLVVQISSKPAEKEKHGEERVKDNKPLSDSEHYVGDGHNNDYDHDAFLGEEEAKTFSDLSPEESKRRLGKIVERIDADNDGLVTQKELKEWIEHQQKRYIYDDVDRQWKAHNLDGNVELTWEEYNATTYSSLPEAELLKLEENEHMDFQTMIRRDKNRWGAADINKNGGLDYEEFVAFIHPEERENMFDIVVEETMEDIDKNHDGKLSVEEYIGDMYHRKEGENSPEPDWVKTEREQFMTFRDKNGDGSMDKEEIKAWILPTDYDHAEAEAKHLIYESDTNRDHQLTKQEIVDKWDLFVGSQATDFGDALTRHDEF